MFPRITSPPTGIEFRTGLWAEIGHKPGSVGASPVTAGEYETTRYDTPRSMAVIPNGSLGNVHLQFTPARHLTDRILDTSQCAAGDGHRILGSLVAADILLYEAKWAPETRP